MLVLSLAGDDTPLVGSSKLGERSCDRIAGLAEGGVESSDLEVEDEVNSGR